MPHQDEECELQRLIVRKSSLVLCRRTALVFHVLLVANAGFEADIVNAWKAEATFMEVAFGCILVHDTPDKHHDPIVVLDLLDCVRARVFQPIFKLPSNSSWASAHRHCNTGQKFLTTRSQHLGITDLDSYVLSSPREDNRSLEVSSWVAEQALRRQPQRVAFVMIFLEDKGGHI